MRLKRVTITGFKSFRDKSVIEFGEGITAIVGPNGCGKSNVLDAIRWALGSGSAKSLRTGKMPDVLFSGTEKSKGKAIAEVKILFEAEGDPLHIGSPEIEIGRKLSSDGLSDYYVNDKNVRLKDLQLLLHRMGLGKEGFWCFEQGKVDQVITWSPEERRAVFEETSGISLYLSQKRDALEKLGETKSKLQILFEREKEAEKLLELLKTQATATEKYLKLKERSNKVERELFGARLFHVEESIKNEEVRHHTLLGERLELEEQEKGFKQQINPLEKEADSCLQDKQKAEEELLHIHHAIENSKKELEHLNGKIRGLENIVQDRKHRIEREEKTKLQIEKEIDELKKGGNSSLIASLRQKLETAFVLREQKEEDLEQILQIEKKEEEERLKKVKETHTLEQKLLHIQQLKRIQQDITHLEGLLWPDLEEKEGRLKHVERTIRQLSEEAAKSSGRLRSLDEIIKKLPGNLPGNLKIQELYPQNATPLLKKFSLKKEAIEKGSALLGPYFNAIAIEDPADLPTLLKQVEGLSFSLYVGSDPEFSLQDWVISPKNFAPNAFLLDEEKKEVQSELKGFLLEKEALLSEENVLRKDVMKKQEEKRKRDWELQSLKEQQKRLPTLDVNEEVSLKNQLEALIITPSNNKGLSLKQELDRLRKEERDDRQKLSQEEKNLEERERKLLLKGRDFEERERERVRLLAEKKDLLHKLSLLPKEKEPIQSLLERNQTEQIAKSQTLARLKEIAFEYTRKLNENKRALESVQKRLVTIRIEEDRSKNIFANLLEKQIAIESEMLELFGVKLEGKRCESTLKELEKEWKEVKQLLESFTDISLTALERYKQESIAFQTLQKDRADLEEACLQGFKWIEELDKESVKKFLDVFSQVNAAFSEAFQKLFKGGSASLNLSNQNEPLSSGIEINAQPPGKAVKSLQLLSGGEKCLIGIALLVALFQVKKAPIALFDEVDAPLDEANLHRFIDLLLPFSKETQVIQITHKRYTMEIASSLLGVTMAERGISKVLPFSLNVVGAPEYADRHT